LVHRKKAFDYFIIGAQPPVIYMVAGGSR